MKKEIIFPIFFLLFFSLILIPGVLAPPPFESSPSEGLTFAFSPYEYVQENTDFYLHLHVINETAIQTNVTTSCLLHLYNSVGEHILESDLGYDSNGLEFKLDIAGGNFTKGQHAYILYCNNTGLQNHLVEGLFEVTESGQEGISIEWMLVIAMVFAYGLILFGFKEQNHPPVTIGAVLLLMISLYIWMNGFGALGTKSLISQFIAAGNFIVGAWLCIKALEDLN